MLTNRYKFNVYNVTIAIILFMSFHCTAYSVFRINTPLSVLLHMCPIAILISKFKIRLNIVNVLWIIFALYITAWNQDIKNGNILGFFYIILSIYIILIFQNANVWAIHVKNISTFFVIEHAILGWLFLIFKPLYFQYVVPRFPSDKWLKLKSYSDDNVLMGLTTHFSSSGIYCSIGLVVAFCSYLQNPKSKWRLFLTLFMAVSLIFTQKRGPLVFAVGACIVMYFLYKRTNYKTILRFIGIGILLALVIIILYNYNDGVKNALSRFIVSEDDDISSGRMPLYNLAIELFVGSPIFGIGWGGYKYEYEHYKFLGGDLAQTHAHNIYLQVLCEIGLLGFIMIYGLMIYTLIKSMHILKNRNEYHLSEAEQWMMLFSVGMQVLFLLSGLAENVLYYEQTLYPYAFGCAITYYEINKIKRSPAIFNKKKVRFSA